MSRLDNITVLGSGTLVKMTPIYGSIEMTSLGNGIFRHVWKDETGKIIKQLIDEPYVVLL